MSYIWQNKDWPHFTYSKEEIAPKLEKFEKAYNKAETIFSLLKPDFQNRIIAYSISDETFSSSEIEGIHLHYDSVVSSISKRLGFVTTETKDKYATEVASVIFDAISNSEPITTKRLFQWDGILTDNKTINSFRTGFVGVYRGKAVGNEELIYEAPPAETVNNEMQTFIDWINNSNEIPVIKSAITSFWFVSIHPFGDGNGRISRALADYVMAVANKTQIRFFSMSKSIEKEKTLYYGLLQKIQGQNKSLDLTSWITWYIDLACEALEDAENGFKDVITLTQSMNSPMLADLNSRQKDILFRIFSKSFFGSLTSEKYRKIEKCSTSQASRDLSEMEKSGFLDKSNSGGRSTSYSLNPSFKEKLLQ